MRVYLIRHGQTDGNIARRHQVDKTPLTVNGREEAKKVAETIKAVKPTHLLSSPLVRAVETAREVGLVCDLIPELNANFMEVVRPKNMYGYHHLSLVSLKFYWWWFWGKEDTNKEGWESYRALRERVERAKQKLTTYPADAIVVVISHSVFMSLFLAHVCNDKPLSLWRATKTLLQIFRMPNAHTICLDFNPDASVNVCPWTPIDKT